MKKIHSPSLEIFPHFFVALMGYSRCRLIFMLDMKNAADFYVILPFAVKHKMVTCLESSEGHWGMIFPIRATACQNWNMTSQAVPDEWQACWALRMEDLPLSIPANGNPSTLSFPTYSIFRVIPEIFCRESILLVILDIFNRESILVLFQIDTRHRPRVWRIGSSPSQGKSL